ncbi:MAG: response regulator [Elusimicrobia bacterium]|nr:response regulator [Elusimicrobiota bacterium]
MKTNKQYRLTWGFLLLAVALHVLMIGRALYLMRHLQEMDLTVSREHMKLTRTLSLTDAVRFAEGSIRVCSIQPSGERRAAYCKALKEADDAAAAVGEAGSVSPEFSESDLAALRVALARHRGSCSAPAMAAADKASAQAEFSRFYETASALRKKLSAQSRARLELNAGLAEAAKKVVTELVVSSSSIATGILLLMFWVVYSLKNFNKAVSEQHEEILVLKKGIEESSLGVVVTDTSGKIEYVNPAFTGMHGYSVAEAVGKNPRLLKSGEMPQELYQSLWRALLGGRSWSGELRNKTKSGALIWIKANISPIRNGEGALTHFMALHKDITLEKQLMAEVMQAKHEAEQANQAKSDFLAAMSHEIRTPLNAIVGMSELIDEAALSKEHAQYLAIMRNASDTLLSIINDVLDISKIEAGKIEVEKAPFNLEELVSQVSEIVSVRAGKKGVEVNCKLEADVPVFVEGDATRLKQVLLNLMGNAVKFVEKGWVSLSVRKQAESGDCLQLLVSVKDTGIGIPGEKLASVFEKFTQADSSTTRKYGGTGLGLPISKMLIELMGGKIWLESEPGVGTIFYFTVKVCPQKDRREVYLPKIDVAELKGKRFLVVDDNLVNRIITREVAQSWGASCEGVSGGEAGLAKLLEEQTRGVPFHGVFVDFNMPGMDGYEFCRRLMADAEITPKPAVALVTSDTVRLKREDFRAIGVNTHIMKPVRKQALLEGALTMLSASVRPAVDAAPKPAGSAKEDLPELSVLIVDDAQDNRILMNAMLKGSRVKLELAVDGFEALAKFTENVYDIVFMDMQMPGIDGYETTVKIRELEKKENRKRTRVVALTAMATREDADKTLQAGCDDYLSKPIRKGTFYSYLVNFAAKRG